MFLILIIASLWSSWALDHSLPIYYSQTSTAATTPPPPAGSSSLATVQSLSMGPEPAVRWVVVFKQNDGVSIHAFCASAAACGARCVERHVSEADGASLIVEGTASCVESLTSSYLDIISFVEQDKVMKATFGYSQILPSDLCVTATTGQKLCYIDPFWHLDRLDQNSSSYYDDLFKFESLGEGVHVYVIDTGMDPTHVNFLPPSGFGTNVRIVESINFALDAQKDGSDCNGHGTHAGGIATGSTSGVAKMTSIHSLRTLACDGSGNLTSTIQALEYVYATAVPPAVVTMSLGVTEVSIAMAYYIQKLSKKGHIVVVAAGNSGGNACLESPSFVPDAITVGATEKDDSLAYFSNYGPCVDMVAPGVDVFSSRIGSIDGYFPLSGTSMATPVVSGTVALMLEINPQLNFNSTKHLLKLAANKAGGSTYSNTTNDLVYSEPVQYTPLLWSGVPDGAVALSNQVVLKDGQGTVDPSNSANTIVKLFTVKATYTPSTNHSMRVNVSLSDPTYGTVSPTSFVIDKTNATTAVVITATLTAPSKLKTAESFFVDFAIDTELAEVTVFYTVEVMDLRTPADLIAGSGPENAIPVLSLPFYYADDLSKYNNTYERFCNVSAAVSAYKVAYSAIGNGPDIWFSIQATAGCDGPGSNTCTIVIDTCQSSDDMITYAIPMPTGGASYINTNTFSCFDEAYNRATRVDNCPLGNPYANVLTYTLTVGKPYMIVVDSYIQYPGAAYQGRADVKIRTNSGMTGSFTQVPLGPASLYARGSVDETFETVGKGTSVNFTFGVYFPTISYPQITATANGAKSLSLLTLMLQSSIINYLQGDTNQLVIENVGPYTLGNGTMVKMSLYVYSTQAITYLQSFVGTPTYFNEVFNTQYGWYPSRALGTSIANPIATLDFVIDTETNGGSPPKSSSALGVSGGRIGWLTFAAAVFVGALAIV